MLRAALALALAAAALSGAPANARPELDKARAELDAYQAKDQRLHDIGWRLVRGNAMFCQETRQSIGLQLVDAAGFGDPETVKGALGILGDFAVQTAAADSPAAIAGLANYRPIRDIEGALVDEWAVEKKRDWKRLERAYDKVDAALDEDGTVDLGLSIDERIEIAGVDVCTTRFELASGSRRALAEGRRVIIGEDFVGFSYPEDELAAAIAHELAHNVLRHRAWLEANGRKRRHVRLTEREADRLMPWLLVNAGYDASAATRFMQKWGPRHDKGIFRARTHDGWDERAESIAAEVDRIAEVKAADGSADWRRHFRREITPMD